MKFLAPHLLCAALCAAHAAHAQTQPDAPTPTPTPTPTPAPAPAKTQEPATAPPSSDGHWRFIFSPYALHYSHSTEHRPVWGTGFEKQRADSYVYGAAFISNSFGQETGYLYGGQRLRNFTNYEQLYAQWTGGVLYGYKHQFQHKVPLNHNGFSPGLVLSLGWQFTPRYSASLNVLGNSALMLQLSAELE